MNSALRDDFRVRADEVVEYFKWLPSVCLPDAGTSVPPSRANFQAGLKATAFLVLYNLVEGTMDRCVKEVSDHLVAQRVRMDQVILPLEEDFLKRILNSDDPFLKAKPDEKPPQRSNVERLRDLVHHAISGGPVNVDLTASGNYGVGNVRGTLRRMGIEDLSSSMLRLSRGGADLDVIVRRRNRLAHGAESFVECGREYTVPDLQEMCRRSTFFLAAVVKRIEQFIAKQEYLRPLIAVTAPVSTTTTSPATTSV